MWLIHKIQGWSKIYTRGTTPSDARSWWNSYTCGHPQAYCHVNQ